MRITPLDIYQKEFKRVLRGIDPDEVEDFLERVADNYEQIIKENAELKERIKSLETQATAGGEIKQTDDSEAVARKEAGNIIRMAKKEADDLIQEARKEADNIVRKAGDEVPKISPEVEEIPEKAFHEGVDLLLEQAEAKAKKLIEKARIEELELRREISNLYSQKERFLLEYRDLLEKHLKLLTEVPE